MKKDVKSTKVKKNLNMTNKKKIKLLISHHKPNIIFQDEILTPIQLGKSLSDLNLGIIGDDTGENISKLNKKFCELTGIYWAWKNQDKLGNPDYIGFMHYRRHFYFKNYQAPLKEFNYDSSYLKSINYSPEVLNNIMQDYDLVIPNIYKLPCTNYKQFKESKDHNIDDLDKALEILYKKSPELKSIAKKYLNNNKAYFCNMFIMKKEIFNQYCKWLFEILFELDSKIDYKNYSKNQQRALGFVAERLSGIYFKYLIEKQNVKYKTYPATLIQDNNLFDEIKPAFSKNNIAVCFAVNDEYSKYFSVSLQSLIENSTEGENYDIIVLAEKISIKNRNLLSEQINNKSNFTLRFVDILNYTKDSSKDIFFKHSWYNNTTYYRFFIQDVFKNYEKVLYLDSDTVVLDDVAKLYNTDLQGKLLGGVQDIEMQRWLNSSQKNILTAYHKKYGIPDSNKYFQAGVLLFDIKKMKDENIKSKLFNKLAEVKTPKCIDQDILNMVLYNKVKYLDYSWNVEWVLLTKKHNLKKVLPSEIYMKFNEALKNPRIIHYCDEIKPWNNKNLPLAKYFWDFAPHCPFYNEIKYKKQKNNNYLLKFLKYEILTAISFGKSRKNFKIERDNIRQRIINK